MKADAKGAAGRGWLSSLPMAYCGWKCSWFPCACFSDSDKHQRLLDVAEYGWIWFDDNNIYIYIELWCCFRQQDMTGRFFIRPLHGCCWNCGTYPSIYGEVNAEKDDEPWESWVSPKFSDKPRMIRGHVNFRVDGSNTSYPLAPQFQPSPDSCLMSTAGVKRLNPMRRLTAGGKIYHRLR